MNNSPIINSKSFSDDEIDIRALFKVLWDGKGLIVALTALFAIAAVIYSLSLPNIYQSKALLSPVGEQGGSNQSMKNLGGLASFAGFDLPNQGGANSIKAMEKLITLSFFKDNILPNIFLPDLMALESWDADNNLINYNPSLYNSEQQTWTEIPSPQKSYKVFMESLNFSKNFDTGSVTIVIKHQSPHIAKEWAELIVNQLNNFFRSKDKQEAQAAMNFLNAQIAQTSLSEIKQVIAQLLQQKIQTLTLIEANEFYVFSYLDPPMVMEEKVEPTRSSISILGAILGGMLGLLFVIIRQYFINRSI
jgi:uncharacterized protein involved in exopolysaccharide biosynthesis